MGRRLTVAILLLVAGTLLITSLVSFLLVRGAANNAAEQQLFTQAQALATYIQAHPGTVRTNAVSHGRLFEAVKLGLGGNSASLTFAGVSPDGTLSGIPLALQGEDLHPTQLLAGDPVIGHASGLVFSVVPMDVTDTQKTALNVPVGDTALLVAMRTDTATVNGFGYFLAVALVALAVAAAVAAWLAHRFSAPLVVAAHTTKRIAEGDLDARIPVGPRDVPEIDELAASINSMGESLVRARDQQRQFLLSVSHELRTPLTSIQGYAEALADGTTDDVQGAVEVIATEARRLERLVRDLLDLAQLDARRFSLVVGPVDVTDAVNAAVESFRPEAAARGVQLVGDAPPAGTAWVTADVDRLRQVLSNLIENAFRYARRGVGVGARVDPHAILLWVVDDGPGIAPEDLPRVFEPHFRSDRAGAKHRGAGLGLAIVAELAAAMGGGVWAESPAGPEGGTRMVVRLPAATPALVPAR